MLDFAGRVQGETVTNTAEKDGCPWYISFDTCGGGGAMRRLANEHTNRQDVGRDLGCGELDVSRGQVRIN